MRLLFLLTATLATSITNAQSPTITRVDNAASRLTTVIAPQMWIAIEGQNLATSTTVATDTVLPLQIAGTSVTFNGVPAALLYVSPAQINAQVPTSARGPIVVNTPSGPTPPFDATFDSLAPGIFTQDASGCGQGVLYNIHTDGSLVLNTPQASLDPSSDVGLMILFTGIGRFRDRLDGTPWQYNPTDNLVVPGNFIGAGFGIPGVYRYATGLAVSYAGPAPDRVGVDQINALFAGPANRAAVPEGCRIPLSFTIDNSLAASQFVNVSIRNGGGACVDLPADAQDTLASLTWRKNLVSDVNETTTSEGVTVQFLQGAGVTFPLPAPQINITTYGSAPAQPSFCAASYPPTLDAGTLTAGGPGLAPTPLQKQVQDGVISYQGNFAPGAIQDGTYNLTASGGDRIGSFTSAGQIPSPIAITTNLAPGTGLPSTWTLTWTGGDDRSEVSVRYFIGPAGAVGRFLVSQSVPASQGMMLIQTGLLPGPHPYPGGGVIPTGPVEIVITQQPSKGPGQAFSATGLTLGGKQTWNYVFDYRGLTNVPQQSSM